VARLALAVVLLFAAVATVVWFAFPQYLPEGWRARPGEASRAPSATTAPATRESPPLYKWRDDQGVWNITDRPPPDRPYERVVVDPNQNVVPTVVPAWAQPADPAAQPEPTPTPR
jgi:hypothetical protein